MAFTRQMVHRGWLSLVVAALLFILSVQAGAEVPSAEQVFERLLESSQTVDFKGRLTAMSQTSGGSPIHEALVIRKAPDKQRIEFIRPQEMRGMGMAMSGKERWRIRSERERGRRPFPPLQPSRMGEFPLKDARLLLQNYDVRVLDGGSVAGRSTYLVEVNPKAAGRPSRKAWMDVEMGIVLKMEQYDPQNRLGVMFVYSEIDFEPDIDEASFQRPDEKEERRGPRTEQDREEIWNHRRGELDLDKINKAVGLDMILPAQSPAGFMLQSIHAMKLGERKSVHLTYTDGLAILSVFESPWEERGREEGRGGWLGKRGEPREETPQRRGGKVEKMNISGMECDVMSRGPMNIFRWNHGGLNLTLMGELSRKEMAGIVSSFVSK